MGNLWKSLANLQGKSFNTLKIVRKRKTWLETVQRLKYQTYEFICSTHLDKIRQRHILLSWLVQEDYLRRKRAFNSTFFSIFKVMKRFVKKVKEVVKLVPGVINLLSGITSKNSKIFNQFQDNLLICFHIFFNFVWAFVFSCYLILQKVSSKA